MVNKEAEAAVLQRLTGLNGSLRLIFADSGLKCVCTNGWVIFLFFFCLCVCVCVQFDATRTCDQSHPGGP